MSKPVLAFDIYGTLINVHGVVEQLQSMVGDQAVLFSQTWRDKQLEYAFRRGLMQNYANFAVCTRDALEYTCQLLKQDLSAQQKQQLLDTYRTLPAFDDVEPTLQALKDSGIAMFGFSNGSADAVETLLQHAGIRDYFDGVVSVDDMKSFKPNPGVYSHFLRQAKAQLESQGDEQETHVGGHNAWLISSNPFDVIGAISAGMRAAWVKRSPDAVFDPWGIEPTVQVSNLTELKQALEAAE